EREPSRRHAGRDGPGRHRAVGDSRGHVRPRRRSLEHVVNPVISEAVAEINLPGASNDHRELYKLIIANRYGVSRKALTQFLDSGDRSARNILAETTILAALHPHEKLGKLVIGHDPSTSTYRVADGWPTALRILTPTLSRIETLLQEAT